MGFRQGAYATIWEVKPISDTLTKGRISISRKNKQTNEYETDFSGFVSFAGTAAANKAIRLKEKEHIRLKDVDVSTKYVREKNVTYTNFTIFSFETQDEINNDDGGHSRSEFFEPQPSVDDGEVGDDLPF